MYVYNRATVSQVNSTSELAALKKNYSVIFLIVHDEEIDHDWHGIFMTQARDKLLKAKFAFTTKPEIVEVRMYICKLLFVATMIRSPPECRN